MISSPRLHLFERVGVEIEYMIVDADTLNVQPIADELFRDVLGEYASDVAGDRVTWSNELVAHVVELKTTEPAKSVREACADFVPEIARINDRLRGRQAILLPGAMHPWMDPRTETKLWPHEGHEVYANFDRVFGCQGHGWSNLQSMHLNLPFAGDDEFARLHAAVRLVLPIIPGLAASSPFEEGKTTGWLDSRLKHYRTNSRKIRAVAGDVIPEPVRSEAEYHDRIFQPMFRAIAPFDPKEEMREEWLNARGAIARFTRGSIEIRVIDSQESPAADAIVGSAIVAIARALVEEKWSSFHAQFEVDQPSLVAIFDDACRFADQAVARNREYLLALGVDREEATLQEIWSDLARRLPEEIGVPLMDLIDRGPLARRILQGIDEDATPQDMEGMARRLADSLASNTFFAADPS
jgi:gamma-glutamyl:cysteine ligase YbdK (ATP-grasp superfamily)